VRAASVKTAAGEGDGRRGAPPTPPPLPAPNALPPGGRHPPGRPPPRPRVCGRARRGRRRGRRVARRLSGQDPPPALVHVGPAQLSVGLCRESEGRGGGGRRPRRGRAGQAHVFLLPAPRAAHGPGAGEKSGRWLDWGWLLPGAARAAARAAIPRCAPGRWQLPAAGLSAGSVDAAACHRRAQAPRRGGTAARRSARAAAARRRPRAARPPAPRGRAAVAGLARRRARGRNRHTPAPRPPRSTSSSSPPSPATLASCPATSPPWPSCGRGS